MSDEEQPKDRFVPIYDGVLSDDPDVVNVLLPTKANIDAMRQSGNHPWAYHLLVQDMWAKASDVLFAAGFKFEMTQQLADLLDTAAFHAVYAHQVDEWFKALPAPPSEDLVNAHAITQFLRFLSGQVADIPQKSWLAAICLAATSMGYAAGQLGASGRALANPADFGEATASDFQRAMQAKAAESRTRWRDPTLARANEIAGANTSLSNDELAEKLKSDAKLTTKLTGLGLTLPGHRTLAEWVGKMRREDAISPVGRPIGH